MDIPNICTAILPLGLFCFLVIWLAVFTWLALRPTSDQQVEEGEQVTALPVLQPPTISLPLASSTSGIRSITQQQPRVTVTSEAKHNIALEPSGHY